jgi:hypothetical protein
MYISIIQKISYKFIVATTLVSLALLGCFSVSSPLNVQAVSDLNVKISINEDDVERGDTQKVTVTVSDNDDTNNKLSDAKAKVIVYPPESDSTTAEDETDGDGKANFKVKIDDDAELGTYDIKVKVSKSGYDTETEESSFDVVSSSSKDADTNDDDDNDDDSDNDKRAKDSKNDNEDDDDDDNRHDDEDDNDNDANGDSQDQTISQGNACGNGMLSTNVLCQNVANQLQGDGNAINIIAMQKGGNDKTEMGTDGLVSNPSSLSPSSSSSSSLFPSSTSSGQDQTRTPSTSLTDDESLASIVDRYKQARIDKAIELRMSYLR